MSSAAKTAFYIRRALLDRSGFLVVAAVAYMLGTGRFSSLEGVAAAVAGVAAALLVVRLLVGWPRRRRRWVGEVDRIELGSLLLAATFIAIQSLGGPESWAQPIAFFVVAYLVGFNSRVAGAVLALAAVGLQTAVQHAAGDLSADWRGWAINGAYILVFAAANALFLQVEVARRRREHQQRLVDEIRAMRQEARDFRLISSALASAGTDRATEESKLTRGAVEAIHQGMYFVLDLLKKSLDLQTCVLLWLDGSRRELRIKELVTDSNLVTETPIQAQAGAIGGVIKNRLLLNLRSPRQGARSIAYYAGPEEVGAFIGVPVLENGHLRGVLCADRRAADAFRPEEEQLLVEAAGQVLRAIQTERVFAAVERSKYEHERFYRASTMLNGALTLSQVYETAFAAAREITDFDFGALTLYDARRRKHTVVRVVGDERERFEGQVFGDNAGLVAMVVKNKHFLPTGGQPCERETVVFTRKLRLRSKRSLVVLPLIVQDQAIGTIVLATEGVRRFSKQTREMLGVIGNQVAVSIENAKMYKRMEEMATTDGLTGLPNHRTFQARFSEMLARAERHNKPVSLVLSDVDKFKSVNDTYGHPVGDHVLRRVAQVLAEEVRKVDLVARYGGEEFAIVLEETDARGAQLLAERVRQRMAAQVMQSDKGAFRVTISLGIASYPDNGNDKQQLIERADMALYEAKETGRNRCVQFANLRRRRRATA